MGQRGRPSFLKDRTSTTVSLEKEDLAKLHELDVDIAVEFREWVKFRLDKNASPLEKMKAEAETLKKSIREDVIKYKRLRDEIKVLENKEREKKAIQLQIEEFENEREIIFMKSFRRLILNGAMCEVDFFGRVKKELKFSTWEEAKVWLLERYLIQRPGEKKFTEDRVMTFLRWDKDVSKYW